MGAYPQTRVFDPSVLHSGPTPIDIPPESETPYLMFDLSGVSGAILAAQLKFSVEMTFISALWAPGNDLRIICPQGWTTPAGLNADFVLPGSNAGIGSWRVLFDFPKKLITLLSGGAASVVTSGGRTFTLRPGVTNVPALIYPDLPSLYAACSLFRLAGVQFEVIFDFQGFAPFPVQLDPGVYDFGGQCIWRGTNHPLNPDVMDIDGTQTTLSGVFEFADNLEMHSIAATAPFHVPATTQQSFHLYNGASWNGDSGPMIDSGAGGLVGFLLDSHSRLTNVNTPVVDLNAGGFSGCHILVDDDAVVGPGVVQTADVNNFLLVGKNAPNATAYSPQAAFAGAYATDQQNWIDRISFGGNVAAGQATYSLPYQGTQPGNVGFTLAVGDTAYTVPLFSPYLVSVVRLSIRIQRAAAGAGSAVVTVRRNGTPIPGLSQLVSFAAPGTTDVVPSSALVSDVVLQPGELLDVEVDTTGGAFTAPQAILVEVLVF